MPKADKIRIALNRIGKFLNHLSSTAEQLKAETRWAIILSVAFVKWLRGKILQTVADEDQLLLNLGT